MKIKSDNSPSKRKGTTTVLLEYYDANARCVCIAGTFNDWNPEATVMLSSVSGQWTKEFSLPPGLYEYQYVVDGKWINDPQAVKSTPNPFGGRNSVLEVAAIKPV